MEAIAYVRVSGKGQIAGDGFDRQEAAITKYAQANGIEIVHVFRELGVSGETEGMDRPAWVDAVLMARQEGIQTILVEKLDRLARLQGIQEYILLDMKKRGLTVVPVDDPTLGSEDPMRVLFRQIIGAIAQYDKTMIVLKTRAARERIRATGEKCEGRKEFGHFPGEQETLTVIRDGVEQQKTVAAITRDLNKRKLPPRKGKRWHQNSVARIIQRNARQWIGVVYFIRGWSESGGHKNGYLKIGFTTNSPSTRLMHIRNHEQWVPHGVDRHTLELIGCMGGTLKDEYNWHDEFKKYKVEKSKEWFLWNDVIEAKLDGVEMLDGIGHSFKPTEQKSDSFIGKYF